jgi:hypothetical protein
MNLEQLDKMKRELAYLRRRLMLPHGEHKTWERVLSEKTTQYNLALVEYQSEQQRRTFHNDQDQSQVDTAVAKDTETGPAKEAEKRYTQLQGEPPDAPIPLHDAHAETPEKTYAMLPEGEEAPIPLAPDEDVREEVKRLETGDTYKQIEEETVGGSFQTQGDKVEGLLEEIVDELRDMNDRDQYQIENGGGSGRDSFGRFTGGDGASHGDAFKHFNQFSGHVGHFLPALGQNLGHVGRLAGAIDSGMKLWDSLFGEEEEREGYIPLAREDRHDHFSGRFDDKGLRSEVGAFPWERGESVESELKEFESPDIEAKEEREYEYGKFDPWREEEQAAEQFEMKETGEAGGDSSRELVDAIAELKQAIEKNTEAMGKEDVPSGASTARPGATQSMMENVEDASPYAKDEGSDSGGDVTSSILSGVKIAATVMELL